MALDGGQHTGDGTAVALSTLVGAGAFRQIDVKADNGNTNTFYLGPSDITTAGANAWITLEAGTTWGAKAEGAGDRLSIKLSELFVIGQASDTIHIVVV